MVIVIAILCEHLSQSLRHFSLWVHPKLAGVVKMMKMLMHTFLRQPSQQLLYPYPVKKWFDLHNSFEKSAWCMMMRWREMMMTRMNARTMHTKMLILFVHSTCSSFSSKDHRLYFYEVTKRLAQYKWMDIKNALRFTISFTLAGLICIM